MSTILKKFFYPNSVCIVGASGKEFSIGYEILRSIKTYSFKGKIFPVNPKTKEVLGYQCYKSILDINETIDLAIIVVAKKYVNDSIDQLIEKKVKSIILITAGFGETDKAGKEDEKKLFRKVKDNNIRLIGPNCMGVINTHEKVKLNATFVAEKPVKGGIGFLSQSGALGAAVLNSLRDTDIHFAHFISVGNKLDITENDILKFWIEDKNINVITLYLESFVNGLKFIETIKNSNNKKPVIVLKAGRTKSGMKAASSHTGALSNDDRIINSLFKQFGIIRVNNLNEMFNTAKGFENFPIPKGKKIAVLTNAGGPAILAVDKLEERGLKIAKLSNESTDKLKEIVPPQGSLNNPIDLLPGGTADNYKEVSKILIEDKNVDAVIAIFVEPVMVNAFNVIESVNSIESTKPIYQVCMPLPEFWAKYRSESKYKTPIFRNPEDPAEIISNILFHESKKNSEFPLVKEHIKTNGNSRFLTQKEVYEVCGKYNIPLVEDKIVSIAQITTSTDFTFPLVIKGLHENLIHKSELNAVKLNIKNKNELHKTIKEMQASFKTKNFEVNKFLIQPFIQTKHELLIGGFRDSSFGPVVMFGSGGKYVEILKDTEIKSAYLTEEDISSMINETKISKIIKGVRGEASCDIQKLTDIIKSVALLITERKDILEIDLNPLIIDLENNYFAVDIIIKVVE